MWRKASRRVVSGLSPFADDIHHDGVDASHVSGELGGIGGSKALADSDDDEKGQDGDDGNGDEELDEGEAGAAGDSWIQFHVWK